MVIRAVAAILAYAFGREIALMQKFATLVYLRRSDLLVVLVPSTPDPPSDVVELLVTWATAYGLAIFGDGSAAANGMSIIQARTGDAKRIMNLTEVAEPCPEHRRRRLLA